MKKPKNMAASVRQRLLNLARKERRPFNELLQFYAMERFLFRLSQSFHANRFILKGALMLSVWHTSKSRPTMDIDMLGERLHDETNIIDQIKDVLTTEVSEDGLNFDPDSIQTEQTMEGASYAGVRVRFRGKLSTARITVQIDIGFGDIVYPKPDALELPTLLDFPPPQLLCYTRESTIAEKLEAAVTLGMLNSRMKDFHDLWLLAHKFNFFGETLAEAIRLTFERRGTEMPAEIAAFTDSFMEAKQSQWATYRNRINHDYLPTSFAELIATVSRFLTPIAASLVFRNPKPTEWKAPGPWR